MFKTICFRKRAAKIIELYSQQNDITFNKGVNDLIELNCSKLLQKQADKCLQAESANKEI